MASKNSKVDTTDPPRTGGEERGQDAIAEAVITEGTKGLERARLFLEKVLRASKH